MKHRLTCLCIITGIFLFSENSRAVTYSVGTNSGFMTQPTSNYYHAVYGGYFDVSLDDKRVFARASYVERPKFVAAGYIDQDYAFTSFIGTKLTNLKKPYGLLAGIGYGFAGGYIKPDPDYPEIVGEKRTYKIPGMVAAIEFVAQWRHIDLAFGHQTLIGYAGKDQIEAYVVWPFNFVLFRMGIYF